MPNSYTANIFRAQRKLAEGRLSEPAGGRFFPPVRLIRE
mgnify:CR=1 FL=1